MNAPEGRFEGGAEWLRTGGREGDVVMSSRIRFARNIAGFAFPHRAKREERRELLALVRDRAINSLLSSQLLWVDLEESPLTERLVLHERHLISKQHARRRTARSRYPPGRVALDHGQRRGPSPHPGDAQRPGP